MIPVLIVDDDFLVGRFLTQIIDWEANGYELLGIARDGTQALTLIREKNPQILLTDIEMPVMDGIQLVKQLRTEGSQIKILILSCHDDFAHVKEGLRSGADEYFLKEELTAQRLLDQLNLFARELSAGEKVSEEDMEQRKQDAEEKHIRQLLEGSARSGSDSDAEAVLAVRVLGYESRAMLGTTEQREGFYRSFAAVLREQLPEGMTAAACHVKGGWFGVLAKFSAGNSRQEKQYLMMEYSNRVLYQADKQFELRAGIGIAEIDPEQKDLSSGWKRAKELQGYIYYERNAVFPGWQYGDPGAVLPDEAELFLQEAEQWRIKGEAEQIRRTAEDAIAAFLREHTRENLVVSWVRRADSLFRVDQRTLPGKAEELRELGEEYAEITRRHYQKQNPYSDSISEAVHYIRENFRENITLNQTAEAVHLTPTYLSFMFHKETGVTFSEYLQNCRIDHAKKLLRETKEKVRAISEQAGYNDYRHFCKTFKKVTGVTPQEYRKG
ncbi:MAG: response regulator [Lachnospiraceae bacterium]|nr:response regulator [Lachnospiraceae bacterium]